MAETPPFFFHVLLSISSAMLYFICMIIELYVDVPTDFL